MCRNERVYGLHTLHGWRDGGDQHMAQAMIALRAAQIKRQRESELAQHNQQEKQ